MNLTVHVEGLRLLADVEGLRLLGDVEGLRLLGDDCASSTAVPPEHHLQNRKIAAL